jgi:hypothetical protein
VTSPPAILGHWALASSLVSRHAFAIAIPFTELRAPRGSGVDERLASASHSGSGSIADAVYRSIFDVGMCMSWGRGGGSAD